MASQATQYPCRKSVAHAQRPGNFSWKPQTGFATCPCFGGCKKSAACGLGVQNDDNPLCFCAVWGGHIANPAKFFLIHDSESEWKTSKRTRATFITTCHESSLQHKSLSHHKTMDHVLEWTKIVHQLVWSQLPLVYHGFSSGTQPGYMKMLVWNSGPVRTWRGVEAFGRKELGFDLSPRTSGSHRGAGRLGGWFWSSETSVYYNLED